MQCLGSFWVNAFDRLNLITPKRNPNGVVSIGEKDVHRITIHPKIPPIEFSPCSTVQTRYQLVEEFVSGYFLSHFYGNHTFMKFHGVPDSVYARDGGHNDHVSSSAQERRGGTQTQFLNFLIDPKVLFNVGVGHWDEGLGLVIIVIRNEVLHEVVREEFFELTIKLSGEGFVVTQNEGGSLRFLNHIGHGKGLS